LRVVEHLKAVVVPLTLLVTPLVADPQPKKVSKIGTRLGERDSSTAFIHNTESTDPARPKPQFDQAHVGQPGGQPRYA